MSQEAVVSFCHRTQHGQLIVFISLATQKLVIKIICLKTQQLQHELSHFFAFTVQSEAVWRNLLVSWISTGALILYVYRKRPVNTAGASVHSSSQTK